MGATGGAGCWAYGGATIPPDIHIACIAAVPPLGLLGLGQQHKAWHTGDDGDDHPRYDQCLPMQTGQEQQEAAGTDRHAGDGQSLGTLQAVVGVADADDRKRKTDRREQECEDEAGDRERVVGWLAFRILGHRLLVLGIWLIWLILLVLRVLRVLLVLRVWIPLVRRLLAGRLLWLRPP